MDFKNSLFFISILLILCFSLSTLSAADADISVKDINEVNVISDSDIGNVDDELDDFGVSEESISTEVNDLSVDEGNLSVGEGTFTELNDLINDNDNVALEKDYKYDNASFKESIKITKNNTIIDGQNHIIDGLNLARAFNVTAVNVTIKNINFVNCFVFGNNSGAVYWSGSDGSMVNCSFVNCSVTNDPNSYNYAFGGAVYWSGSDGSMVNCSFVNCSTNCTISGYTIGRGAVYWSGSDGSLSNCSFVDCYATDSGGAVYWSGSDGSLSNCSFVDCSSRNDGAVYWSGSDGSLSNCSFVDCSAKWDGGNGKVENCSFVNCFRSISWSGVNGSVVNCNFINCGATYGGVVFWSGVNGSVVNCSFVNCSSMETGGAIYWHSRNGKVENCSFVDCYATDSGGAIDWIDYSGNGSIVNCSFVNCSAVNASGGAIYWHVDGGSVVNCSFVDCSAKKFGGAIYWHDDRGSVSGCNFTNCKSIDGGAIHWGAYDYRYDYGAWGSVVNCSFVECSASNGGAVYWSGSDGSLSNCSFVECSANSGGAIYWGEDYYNYAYGARGSVVNCSFVECSANSGGAIEWSAMSGSLSSCSFVNCSSTVSEIICSPLYLAIINCTSNHKMNSSVNITVLYETYYTGSANLKITVPLLAYGKVTATLYGQNYTASIKEGVAIVEIDHLKAGIYNLNVFYEGNDLFNNASNNITLNITKLNPSIYSSSIRTTYNSGSYIYISTGDVGLILTLKIYTGSKLIKTVKVRTDEDGCARYYGSTLPVGTHKVVIIFEGNANLNKGTGNCVITIYKAKTIVTAKKVTYKKGAKKYFAVTIKNKATKKVVKSLTLKIKVYTGKKYKTYTVKTNSKGVAKLSTKYLKKGKHKVVISSGNKNYSVSKKGTLIVIK